MLTCRQILAKNYINARGWHTRRKIVVIESDDWGSIRMPSRKLYDYFLSKGIEVDKSYFDKNDSLESSEDLEFLFEVLSGVKDKHGNSAVLTPCTIVANPDFEKIEASGKRGYAYELLTDTYKRSVRTEKSFQLYKEGVENRIFYPQFHGREHINVKRWMEAINSPIEKEQLAFSNQSVISSEMINSKLVYPLNYFAAFDYDDAVHEVELNEIIEDGLNRFEALFGFRSLSFVPCCGISGNSLNEVTFANGVQYLQCGQQLIPQGEGRLRLQNRFWGDVNQLGQIYWRRNCTFEPSRNQDLDWVDRCLQEIKIAFRWGKPAVINSHRVNFIGSIFPENRDKTLKQFARLLREIQKRWPEVEFMDSERLALTIGTTHR